MRQCPGCSVQGAAGWQRVARLSPATLLPCLPLPTNLSRYLAHTEAQTFLASLRTALGLDPSCSLEACANRLEQLLSDRWGWSATGTREDALAAATLMRG